MSGSLDGRVAVITGAAGGIGLALCETFAARGATVVGVDRAGLAEAAAVVEQARAGWLAIECDLADPTAPASIGDAVRAEFGRCDILVNNAAIEDPVSWDDLDEERWRMVLCIDLDAPYRMCRALVPLMRSGRWGRIINITSGSVLNPMPRFVAYRTAKMGLIGLTRALATELGDDGITVNAVSPGMTATPMIMHSFPKGALEAAAQARAIKRVAMPQDVAGAVVMLTGDDAAFITGQTLLANGGGGFL